LTVASLQKRSQVGRFAAHSQRSPEGDETPQMDGKLTCEKTLPNAKKI
jgi:hypothetical protein